MHGTDGRSHPVEAADVTALPELDLALLRTGGLSTPAVEPTPIVLRDRIDAGTYVKIAAHGWREARVLGTAPVTYTANGRSHRIGAALELALGTDGRDALRLGGAAVGGPVLDPERSSSATSPRASKTLVRVPDAQPHPARGCSPAVSPGVRPRAGR